MVSTLFTTNNNYLIFHRSGGVITCTQANTTRPQTRFCNLYCARIARALLQRVACSQEVKDFHGCNLLVLREQIQVSMALFLSTNIHQGDNLFSVQSRGKQCAFMSLSAVLTAQNIPLIDRLVTRNIR